MKAISIRQPWAYAICHLGKDIENRSWRTHYRGPVAIHAGANRSRVAYLEADDFIYERLCLRLPPTGSLDYGGIVGVAEIIDCIRRPLDSLMPWNNDYSRWHEPGYWGWRIANARPVPFAPFKGALSFFDVPDFIIQP